MDRSGLTGIGQSRGSIICNKMDMGWYESVQDWMVCYVIVNYICKKEPTI